jgi:hypothetical protein
LINSVASGGAAGSGRDARRVEQVECNGGDPVVVPDAARVASECVDLRDAAVEQLVDEVLLHTLRP